MFELLRMVLMSGMLLSVGDAGEKECPEAAPEITAAPTDDEHQQPAAKAKRPAADVRPAPLPPLGRAIAYLARYHKNPLRPARVRRLTRYFLRYGRLWGVDPWLAASIACQESIFRDHPRKVRVRRCRTVFRRGRVRTVCRDVWGGERGIMQMIPAYSKQGFYACTGRHWKDPDELSRTKISICVGIWMLARRRHKIAVRHRAGKSFRCRGGDHKYTRHYAPCNRRQRRFCRHGPRALCRRFWWAASYNWGSHKVVCGRITKGIDFAGYPIRVIRRYAHIVKKFRYDRLAQRQPRQSKLPKARIWAALESERPSPSEPSVVDHTACNEHSASPLTSSETAGTTKAELLLRIPKKQ
jgi:hypothetical protein